MAPAMASAILAGMSWFPGLCPWLIAIAFVPAWRQWLDEREPKWVFFAAWLLCFLGTPIGFYWISSTAHSMWNFSPFNSVLILVAFALISNLYIPIVAWIWAHLRNRFGLSRFANLCGLGVLLYLSEFIVPKLFPFNLGYPWMWSELPIRQLAGIVGVSGLSLLTYLLNACLLEAWLRSEETGHGRSAAKILCATLLAFALLNWGGLMLEKKWSHFDRHLKIIYVQASLPEHFESRRVYGFDYEAHELQQLMNLTREAIKREGKSDLILWPENSLLVKINTSDPIAKKIMDFANEIDTSMMIGLESLAANKAAYGSIATLGSDGKIVEIYNKVVLIPFGEYIPGVEMFPFLKVLDRNSEPMVHGESFDKGVVNLLGTKIGTNICYEDIMPWVSRELVKRGAKFFVNLSSDIWFGETMEPYQHGHMALARAIEFRRPLIRVTTTGISEMSLANGESKILTKTFEKKTGSVEVQFLSVPEFSFYYLYGEWIPYLVFGMTAGIYRWLLKRRHRKLVVS